MLTCGCQEICAACRQGGGETYRAVKDEWLLHLTEQGDTPTEAIGMPPARLALADHQGTWALWDHAHGVFRPERQGPPSEGLYAWFEITTVCDQVCRHCFMWERLRKGHMPTDVVLAAVTALSPYAPSELVLSGGETTLHPALADIVAAGLRTVGRVRVLTNGRSRQPEVLAAFRQPGVTVEIPVLGDQRGHETMTGVPGSFRRAVEAIRLYRSLGVHVIMTTTLTRYAEEALPTLQDLARALGVEFRPSRLFPVGRAVLLWDELAPSELARA
jgi:MoaA/NifB/PqqE/SkfB family radical SAM enzyme